MRLIYIYCETNLWALTYTDLTTAAFCRRRHQLVRPGTVYL
jgi:hypothetical protein